ncbi:hypothetical protein ABZ383_27385 [Streptomyces sp. NPDC005900]|uniref:hypothetical protein n=1 Tax=Streptomyces sp. NPDC005900 TaxID=3154569 RepID=UPI00340FEADB
MTHTPNHPTRADYNTLSPQDQDRFDALMQQADTAGPATYAPLMATLAILTGIHATEIRKCACSCWCGAIFDAEHPDAHVIEESGGYNLGRHQCPWCADQHQETT